MGKVIKDLTDAEILRFHRFSVVESAAATFTQSTLDTQLSLDRGVIMLIHFLQFYILPNDIDDPAQDTNEELSIQITRESKSAMVSYEDSDLIERHTLMVNHAATIGTEAGPMIWTWQTPQMYQYSPPIPYAAQNLYIGVLSNSAAAKSGKGRIGYSLREVNEKFFFRVAHALLG